MKKILKFEVEEGNIECEKCPFRVWYRDEYICRDKKGYFDCKKYDLSTLKFIGDDEGNS